MLSAYPVVQAVLHLCVALSLKVLVGRSGHPKLQYVFTSHTGPGRSISKGIVCIIGAGQHTRPSRIVSEHVWSRRADINTCPSMVLREVVWLGRASSHTFVC
jgi:hypothetical protein